MSERQEIDLAEVRLRLWFLEEGMRDYIWVLGSRPSLDFFKRVCDVMSDKVKRLQNSLDK